MKVKKWLFALATFAVMAVVCAVAAGAETYGDFEYGVLDDGTVEITDYNGSAKTVDIPEKIDGKSVTEIGNWAFSYCESLTSITIPDGVTSISYNAFGGCISLVSITIPDSVTSISDCAFKDCTNLVSITIPDSVTSIGDSTFSDCKSLTNITIPNNVTEIGCETFNGCTSLTSITIPNSVTSIGDSAFNDCTSITSITIPNSVTSIGDSAFRRCTNLTALNVAMGNKNFVSINGVLYNKDKTTIICYPVGRKDKNYKMLDSVASIGDYAFYGCESLKSITIPDSVTYIGDDSFYGCTSLKSITIPDSVKRIGNYAFSGCASLTSITIPESVTEIGECTFSGCTSLTSITMPDSTTEISGFAFQGCSNLTSITIPNSVKIIGYSAFSGCKSLTSIMIPAGVTTIGQYAFAGCTSFTAINVATGNQNYVSVNGVLYNKDKTVIICYPAKSKDESYKIFDGVTRIGDYAFCGCKSLKSIVIPNGVTTIGESAFNGCTGLTSIVIPDSVLYIDNNVFKDCASLTSLNIPNGVTNIGYMAFYGCTSLTAINVATGNKNYVSVNGVLCNKDKTILICCPAEKTGNNYKILDGVTWIDGFAFRDCTNLTSITIPDSVWSIGSGAFEGCTSLTAINVATGNQNYVSVNGILYSKDKTKLIFYPAGKRDKSYSILDSVTEIGSYAFENCTSLTSITIPDSVTEIGDFAFRGCTSLTSVTIPSSVTQIGKMVFGYYYDRNGYKKINNFKIYCYKGTAGEQYAKDNGFTYELLDKPTPAKVSGVKLGGRAADALRINWTKNANADGYIVEMYQGGKWVRVAKITNNSTTTFRKAGLKAGTVYKFRVKAFKMYDRTAAYSAYSATVAARTNPSVINGAKLGGRAVDALRINWSKNASADGYIVEMYQGGKWVRVAKITNSNTTTFRKVGLKASTVYKFRVRAYKMSGKTALYGNYSATVTARTNPSVMKGVKIAGKAKDALRVSWTKNSSAQGYIVEMYKGGKWVRAAKITNGNTTTFRKAGLAKNTTYKFRVKAYYMSGKTALYGNYGYVSGKTAAK